MLLQEIFTTARATFDWQWRYIQSILSPGFRDRYSLALEQPNLFAFNPPLLCTKATLITLPKEIIYKILSYVEGNLQIYMNLALCCKRLYLMATSDYAWRRFNVHNVQGVYQHFLAERKNFHELEYQFYHCTGICRAPLELDITLLSLYTQLVILLRRELYCTFCGQLRDRRVMELGALEPGNLLFYACDSLRADPYLARLSLRSRQLREIVKPPREWAKELQLDWHFSYMNLDSEIHAPYSPDFYRLDLMRGCDYFSAPYYKPLVLLDDVQLDLNNRLCLLYHADLCGYYVKFGNEYFDAWSSESIERTETDPAYRDAVIESGCPIACLRNPPIESQIRALERGGERDAYDSELDLRVVLEHNTYAIPHHLSEIHDYATRTISIAELERAMSRNAKFCGWPAHASWAEKDQLHRAARHARLNGRLPRYENIKFRRREWFHQNAVDRPMIGLYLPELDTRLSANGVRWTSLPAFPPYERPNFSTPRWWDKHIIDHPPEQLTSEL